MGLFDEQVSREPDLYPWAKKEFIKSIQDNPWNDREFNFQSDIQDFKVKLSSQERDMIVKSLSAIGHVETQIKKWWSKLGDNLPNPSMTDLGFVMAYTEVVHGDAYSRLLKVLGIKESFEDILKLDIIRGRDNYLKKHIHKFHSDNRKQFVYSIILFTLFVENISLFSQFYVINWFGRYRNLLKDTNKQVEYTSREENLHALAGMKIINVLRKEYPDLFDEELEKKILFESEQAVKYEMEIVDWIVNGFEDPKLNSNLLKEFIKSRMNDSLKQIGYKRIFEIDKKILKETDWFDEQLLGNNMTDFFHSKPTEYSKNNKSFKEEDLF